MPHGSCLTSHSHHYNLAEQLAIRPSLNPLVVHYQEHLSTKTQMCVHQIVWPIILGESEMSNGQKTPNRPPEHDVYATCSAMCLTSLRKKKRGSFSLLLYRRLQTLRLD